MRGASFASALAILVAGSVVSAFAPACGSSNASPGGDGGANGSSGASSGSSSGTVLGGSSSSGASSGSSSGGPCVGLQCSINLGCGASVNGGHNTSISGYVYDPAGNNPLYNVVVYVPNGAVQALPAAPSGDCSCSSLFSGDPVAAGTTDATGHFVIPNAPDNAASPGTPIPLVVQIGKWRKQTSIATVAACTDNGGTTQKLTLPSKADANDDLPQIAVSTGGADTLECLLRRIGVDATEYTRGAGGAGHIHIFQGGTATGLPKAAEMPPDGGVTPSSLGSLFDQGGDLSPYDILILSCEGQETTGTSGGGGLTSTELAGLQAFTTAGGRAFLSHLHYTWLTMGPFSTASPPLAAWTPGPNPIEDKDASAQMISGDIVQTLADGGPFYKGQTFASWLGATNALQGGALPIVEAKHNADVSAANTASQPWIAADPSAVTEDGNGNPTTTSVAGATQYFTFDTPLGGIGVDDAGVPEYCGRVVYSDLHVGAASGDYTTQLLAGQPAVVPDGCGNNPLSPQEKALEFMLFDLSSCVTPDTGPGSGGGTIIIH